MENREYEPAGQTVVTFVKYTVMIAWNGRMMEKIITGALYLFTFAIFTLCIDWITASETTLDVQSLACEGKIIPSICGFTVKFPDGGFFRHPDIFKSIVMDLESSAFNALYSGIAIALYIGLGFTAGVIVTYTGLTEKRRDYVL